MKKIIFIILLGSFQAISAQIGIGTTTPTPGTMLDVSGTVKIQDGTEGENKILVSDATGKSQWKNETDGVKTRIIRQINGGTSTEVILWSHPAGIVVKFDPSTEKVTVENNTGDATHYWDVVIEGDARTASGNSNTGVDRYKKRYIVDGETLFFDLGDVDSGWFNIVAADQNNEKDGFIMHIVYYNDDLNGIVQYWNN